MVNQDPARPGHPGGDNQLRRQAALAHPAHLVAFARSLVLSAARVKDSFESLTQAFARSSLVLGYFRIVPDGISFWLAALAN